MERQTEPVSKAEIEEKIARLVRRHHDADPRICTARENLRVSFWMMVLFTSTAIAAFTLVILGVL